ncbi:MAG: hypothetical protein HYU73_17805 [Betaproteobacteria bacterium]|nr:hypothetical protein [Betaproteobacteria bacterium]MBI3057226.1 hypothetical protein [Betaproteobacteria bacterium]
MNMQMLVTTRQKQFRANVAPLICEKSELHMIPTYPDSGKQFEFTAKTVRLSQGTYSTFAGTLINVGPPIYTVVSEDAIFQELVLKWRAERGATSSITEMAMCRSYLQIIAIGPRAITLIFRQMEQEGDEPDMWFVALQMLTGADPVTEEARGDFKAMADLWLNWGRASGYAW